jgi:3-oxoadipate enol-lactonase
VSTKGTIAVEDGRIAYELAGSGPAVVLVHSGLTDRRQWDREFPQIARRSTVVRYDLRGFGGSSPAWAAFSPVRDLRAVIVGLGLRTPLVVGSSLGGAIALDLALDHPGIVRGLLLVAPALSGGIEPPYSPEEAAAFEQDERRIREVEAAWVAGNRVAAFEALRELWCPALEGPALEQFRRMVEENAEEVYGDRSLRFAEDPPAAGPRLGSLRVGVHVLVGGRDNPAAIVFARRIATQVPGGRLTLVERADHLVNLSAPEAFDSALEAADAGHA